MYAGYAGVAGGGVVPLPAFTNASSASAIGSILFSDTGEGIPVLLGRTTYVVYGAPLNAAMLGGMYVNLENGLGLDGALLLAMAMGAPVEARSRSIGRKEREVGPDGARERFIPTTRFGHFGATGLSGWRMGYAG